ncbi:MAG: hypothetical protein QM628_15950 [Propionicimonas sp.]
MTLEAAGSGIDGPRSVTGGLVAPGSLIRDLPQTRLAETGTELTVARATPATGAAMIARAFRRGGLPAIVTAQLTSIRNP